ncbi:MAG TPA: TraR/DksA C4-type zinc finger protein [Nevskiaceae bacterium]
MARMIRSPKLTSESELLKMPENAYMNDAQLAFFKARLLKMREELSTRAAEFATDVHGSEFLPDPSDRATAEEELWRDARLREREEVMMQKIGDALERIRTKDYGYCERTGDPIGLRRLLARPTATTCIGIKERDERHEALRSDRRVTVEG